jgi:phosphatidylglycerophosphatase A
MRWNNMEDIKLARSLLEEEKLNLVIVKEGQVLFSSRESGVAPFFQAVQNMGNILHNAAVADRIVGLAVAMLCLHARIASVYAGIVSTGALDMLKRQGVNISSRNVVPHIFDYDGTDLCPFEKLAQNCQEPSQLFAALQSLFAEGGP